MSDRIHEICINFCDRLKSNKVTMYGEELEVAEDNDHLGLVVSGNSEELKNIDKNIHSARKSLFNFLGNKFAYK